MDCLKKKILLVQLKVKLFLSLCCRLDILVIWYVHTCVILLLHHSNNLAYLIWSDQVLVQSSCGSFYWSYFWTLLVELSSPGQETAGSSRCLTPQRWGGIIWLLISILCYFILALHYAKHKNIVPNIPKLQLSVVLRARGGFLLSQCWISDC